MLSNPQVAVGEMLALALALGLELGLAYELVEPVVLVVGTGSVWVLGLLPLPRVVMAQPAGAHRLRMQGDPGWDQTALRLEQLAAVLSR